MDPNSAIPGRYQAQSLLTADGKVTIGMKIYKSVDGNTLLTAESVTHRFDADQIETIQPSAKSLMPDGLLDGLSNQEVADLILYLCGL